jgi:putative transposase
VIRARRILLGGVAVEQVFASISATEYNLDAMRHTTFRFTLVPASDQATTFARHAGASRFAYNQSLRLVIDALTARQTDPSVTVPCSGFDLVNAFNTWKRGEQAGRLFAVASDGTTTKQVTGLPWRRQVSAQVFEEAAIDLGRALAAHAHGGDRKVGFPTPKRKGRCRDSFRLRNKKNRDGDDLIRIGDGPPRSVTLPKIGIIRVHDDTRRLRRLLRPIERLDPTTGKRTVVPRARILFATVARHGDRWYVCLNVRAPDLHAQRRHPRPLPGEPGRYVGVDRGLTVFAVAATADGVETAVFRAPKPLANRLGRLRRRSRALSRAKHRSRNRARAARRLSREHVRIANIRRSFQHQVSSQLAKTHSRLAIENLATANLIRNRHLGRAIADAGWAELARQLTYKTAWFGGELVVCDRWFPSTKTCSCCGAVKQQMGLADRIFRCEGCGLVMDRDRNAAANLAAWAEAASMAAAQAPDRQAGGRVTNAPGGEGAGGRLGDGETDPKEGGTDAPALAGVEDTREGWRRTSGVVRRA